MFPLQDLKRQDITITTYRKLTVVCKQLNSQSSILVPGFGRNSDKSGFEWSLEIVCYNTATAVVTNEHLKNNYKHVSRYILSC